MISITRTSIDAPGGPVQLRNYRDSAEYDITARLNRVKTLDGGCAFSHSGVTDSDRDFIVECRLTQPEYVLLDALHRSSALIRIAFKEGIYLGFIYRLRVRPNKEATITFYFKEKIA